MRFGAKGLRAVLATTAALVAVLVVAGVAGAAGPQHRHHDRRPGGEFYFKLSEKTLPRPGTVTFVFRNVGHLSHDFKHAPASLRIESPAVDTSQSPPTTASLMSAYVQAARPWRR
jgi:hypothetical protein